MEEDYQKELNNIEQTVQKYVDAVIEFNFELAEDSWHPDGVKIFYDEEDESLNLLTILQTRPDSKPKGKISQSAEIKEINRVGKAATVLLQWLMERDNSKFIFTDFISLLKIKEQWKIVAKVYDVNKLNE